MAGSDYSALADKDETLKKILDDQAVTRVYEKRQRQQKVQDFINNGILPPKALKSDRTINVHAIS